MQQPLHRVQEKLDRETRCHAVAHEPGELALLDHGPRTASVVAESELRLFVLTARRFNAVLDEAPGLSRKLLGALASRVRELDSKTFG